MRFEGKVAVLTGGAGRIGGETARQLVREGASVVIGDLPGDHGENFAESLRNDGAKAVFQPIDVTKADEAEALINRAVDEFGTVDILVNCAGWMKVSSAIELEEEDFDRIIDTHVKGTWLTCKYALPHMMKQGSGSIVNISSMQALGALPGRMTYEAAKAGISAITRQLALEYGPAGIRVNAVLPGVIRSHSELNDRFDKRDGIIPEEEHEARLRSYPLRRLGLPEDVAGPILFLASDDAGWVTGVNLLIDGGHSIQLAEAVAYPPFYRLWQHNVPQA